MRRTAMHRLLSAPTAAVLLLLASCGGDDDPRPPASEPGSTSAHDTHAHGASDTGSATGEETTSSVANGQVLVRQFRYQPQELEIVVGSEVTWVNDDGARHSADSAASDSEEAGDRFAITLEANGGQGSFTFDEVGEFPYFCRFHTSMTGVIRVVAE